MQKPTWVKTVGVLTILFGLYGILGGVQQAFSPLLLGQSEEMFEQFESVTRQFESDDEDFQESFNEGLSSINKLFKKMTAIPPWFQQWMVASGIVSTIIAICYFLGGVFLLMLKPFAPKLIIVVLIASIFWSIVKAIMFFLSGTMIAYTSIPGSVFSIIIDTLFLVVVLISSKEAFEQPQARALV